MGRIPEDAACVPVVSIFTNVIGSVPDGILCEQKEMFKIFNKLQNQE